ncbi:MAG: molybdopterin-guanine dinucleotide biosynthesis protein A [Halonotius sp. J07HN6]|nr:MAG: molybdopterin-guanine dinucleotide biosynthesis protein A [Halonotius sp. J07HN6]
MSLTNGDAATADTGRVGIILAGGRSERFPTVDKALAPLDGVPLIHHAAATLEPAVDDLVINCREDQQAAFADALAEFDPAFAIDAVPDRGPLAGLRTALESTTATYAAVLPCDMPLLPAAFVEYLFDRARDRTGAVPKIDGQVQPLPAALHVRAAAAACRDAREQDAGRLDAFVPLLDPHVVPERVVEAHTDPDAFRNINTHDDLAAIRGHPRHANQS